MLAKDILAFITSNIPVSFKNFNKTKFSAEKVKAASKTLKTHDKLVRYLFEAIRFSFCLSGGDMVMSFLEKEIKKRITEENLIDWDIDYLLARKKKNCIFFLDDPTEEDIDMEEIKAAHREENNVRENTEAAFVKLASFYEGKAEKFRGLINK